jgi:hypothetical protein
MRTLSDSVTGYINTVFKNLKYCWRLSLAKHLTKWRAIKNKEFRNVTSKLKTVANTKKRKINQVESSFALQTVVPCWWFNASTDMKDFDFGWLVAWSKRTRQVNLDILERMLNFIWRSWFWRNEATWLAWLFVFQEWHVGSSCQKQSGAFIGICWRRWSQEAVFCGWKNGNVYLKNLDEQKVNVSFSNCQISMSNTSNFKMSENFTWRRLTVALWQISFQSEMNPEKLS